jgi:hypothetical protein
VRPAAESLRRNKTHHAIMGRVYIGESIIAIIKHIALSLPYLCRFCFLAAPRMPILCCVMQLESHESLSIIPQGNKSNHPPLLLIGRAMQLLPLPSCTLVIFSPRCHCQCKICCCEKIIDEAAAVAAAISPCVGGGAPSALHRAAITSRRSDDCYGVV